MDWKTSVTSILTHPDDLYFYKCIALQVGTNTLFSFNYNYNDENELVQYTGLRGVDPIIKIEKATPPTRRDCPSMVHYDGFLFLIGGYYHNGGYLKSVDTYSIGRNSWRSAPQLNQARYSHSSCVLGHSIYTFGGVKGVYTYYDSIESIDAQAVVRGMLVEVQWNLIQLSTETTIPARKNALMASIGPDQILIAGGDNGMDLITGGIM